MKKKKKESVVTCFDICVEYANQYPRRWLLGVWQLGPTLGDVVVVVVVVVARVHRLVQASARTIRVAMAGVLSLSARLVPFRVAKGGCAGIENTARSD